MEVRSNEVRTNEVGSNEVWTNEVGSHEYLGIWFNVTTKWVEISSMISMAPNWHFIFYVKLIICLKKRRKNRFQRKLEKIQVKFHHFFPSRTSDANVP